MEDILMSDNGETEKSAEIVKGAESGKKANLKKYMSSFHIIWGTIYLIAIILGICIWCFGRTVNISLDSMHIMLLCMKLICISFQKFLTFIGVIGEILVFANIRGKYFTFYATISIIVIVLSAFGLII